MDTITIKNLGAVESAAEELIEAIADNRIVAFYGEMGAGKTTIISEICRQLGDEDRIGSPSFSIVNAYRTTSGRAIYHFDFYRIKSTEEAFDFGYEEYFYGGDLCLVEWPEMIEELLPEETLRLRITVADENHRKITKC